VLEDASRHLVVCAGSCVRQDNVKFI
jgi:hypothetical protein